MLKLLLRLNKTFIVKSKIEDNINMIYVCILSLNMKNLFTFSFRRSLANCVMCIAHLKL